MLKEPGPESTIPPHQSSDGANTQPGNAPDSLERSGLGAWLRLRHCKQLSPSTALRLIQSLGDADAVFNTPDNVLRDIMGNASLSRAGLRDINKNRFDKDVAWFSAATHHRIVPFTDSCYPALLKEIPDPPLLLYVDGDPGLLESAQLAIVGSRNPTAGGRALAFRFAASLARAGFTITSGLATGIDGRAHLGAMSVSGPTIAVMATGLDLVYPASHQGLARDIACTGVLVSEVPAGTRPTKWAFPRRNRIISGLSIGTLVVEATRRSGSLITARLAGEQGREVFAVPGSILSPQSQGCHALIRDGARLVQDESDIFSELGHFHDCSPPADQNRPADESEGILGAMGYDPVAIDTLVSRCGLTAATVSSMLLRLELRGVVKTVSGGHYIRVE